MFDHYLYDRKVYKVLKALSRQRVGMILKPGNIWVIEFALKDSEETEAILRTCEMRGWVETLQESVPKGELNQDGTFKTGVPFSSESVIWRLTDSGWAAIQRRHELTLLGLVIAIVGAAIAAVA